ncbi:probable LRR receptor-like serine/threonine-protein kinase At1g67720 [Sesamum indicum]|uniref:Probable LRR receptor-like serine/threonine-protein kinase At1g67720 n=1 Tax=Sesamum indicum TaxID=4182 RepID=A0A6I9SPG3_SESIN|nr:probable LRR receptor-like serine/threonine-protein kinase At1g67720 [Sesamum indicum]
MMITPFLFLSFLLLPVALSQLFRDVFIDCGANVKSTFNDLEWLPDNDYISAGTSKNITAPVLVPTLATVRTFPLQNNAFKKFCYEIPVDRTRKYLIRATYYYGGVNGNVNPPVFDQIVDGTLWSVVNTTDDYLRGDSSYYEGVFMPTGKNLSVCLAANTYTDSDPFISALEVVLLWDQLYNSTDFKAYSLSLVARHSFGYDGPVIAYPDDQFYRYWSPFGEDAFPQSSLPNLAVSGIWNLPPPKVFQTRLAKSQPEPLTLFWPPGPVASDNYSIALYFADDQTASGSSRTIDITINGVAYYNNLSVIPAGVVVFANPWPLSGITNLTLAPSPGSTVGPLINAGEVFHMLPTGGKTLPRDVIAMINLRKSFQNPPADWHGDPCLPSGYSWTGVTCSEGPRIRIITLNLTSIGLSGSISPSISRMTALNSILLGNNSLMGTIPDLSSLKGLEILHLENNQLGGTIHPSLGNLRNLRELFLQNNNLTGQVPSNLAQKPGLTLRYTPGNPFLHP